MFPPPLAYLLLKEGIQQDFAEERKELRDIVSDLRYRVQTMVRGQWWLTIPKWVFILFVVLIIAAVGFGYGFFHELNENSKLKDVEWLYRYERGLNRELNVVMHRESLMLHGTVYEVDSMKSLIRFNEQRVKADTTFIYYYPINN